MSQSKAAPVKLTAAERRLRAVELRKLGLSYAKIAEQLGVSQTAAYNTVMKALKEINEKTAEGAAEVRRLELERLDEWLVRVAKEAQSGNTLGAIDRGLRIQARRAKLLGLDAPVRLELGEMEHELSMLLISAMEAGDLEAAEAGRLISEGKAGVLQAWVKWWKGARLPLTCTPDDVAKMTAEELALAAQGELMKGQLEEIRERAAGDSDPAAE